MGDLDEIRASIERAYEALAEKYGTGAPTPQWGDMLPPPAWPRT